jgi:hypothetical protein
VKLKLELESDRIRLGERVVGRVIVLECGSSRSVTLTLSFIERTGPYTAVANSSGFVLHQGELAAGQTLDFDFTMPADSRPSLKTKHSELFWELDVHSDEPGLDSYARRQFHVASS